MTGRLTERLLMGQRILFQFLLAFGLLHSTQAQSPQDKWDAADLKTVRLAPAAFPQLPKDIVQNLAKRGCTIPQSFSDPKPHNVIRGEFARKGQSDWAVLCSAERVSSILIFWGGSVNNTSEIAKGPDKNLLQGIDDKENIGYSRAIGPVAKGYIEEHYHIYGGTKPPPIDHEGIDDAFIEKGSEVHYFYRGKWLRLTGSD